MAGYNKGDSVSTPEGMGTVQVACVKHSDVPGTPPKDEDRYYWIEVSGKTKRFEAKDLPPVDKPVKKKEG